MSPFLRIADTSYIFEKYTTCWSSGREKTSPKMVTLAFDKPLHPGICTNNVHLGSTNKFLVCIANEEKENMGWQFHPLQSLQVNQMGSPHDGGASETLRYTNEQTWLFLCWKKIWEVRKQRFIYTTSEKNGPLVLWDCDQPRLAEVALWTPPDIRVWKRPALVLVLPVSCCDELVGSDVVVVEFWWSSFWIKAWLKRLSSHLKISFYITWWWWNMIYVLVSFF